MSKRQLTVFAMLLLAAITVKSPGQSVGINNPAPATSSILDITSTNKGVLIPRMTSAERLAIAAPANGLLVYETTTNQFFYFDGTIWKPISGNTAGWNTTGNAGTAAGTNFIGTTDNTDMVVKTNNLEKMRVTSAGNVGIGTSAPVYKLHVNGASEGISIQGTSATASNLAYMTFRNSIGTRIGYVGDGGAGEDNVYLWSDWGDVSLGTIAGRVLNVTSSGYVGIGTTTPITKLHVVADMDNFPVVYGVNTNLSTGTSSYGVRGECGSTGLGSAGVSGVSTNSGQNEIGVLGDYSLWGASIFGLGWASSYSNMPATKDFGVFGTATYSTGTGVGAYDGSNSFSSQALYAWGRTVATGTKSASVPTTKGNQLLYCTESPEIWFEDIGSAQLVNGVATVNLDSMFMETVQIDNTHPMQVFIQENGESNGVYVIKDKDHFTVKEKNGGSSTIEFSYRILAKRRFYQDHRFGVDAMQDFGDNLSKAKYVEPTTTDPQIMKEMVEQANAEKIASGKK